MPVINHSATASLLVLAYLAIAITPGAVVAQNDTEAIDIEIVYDKARIIQNEFRIEYSGEVIVEHYDDSSEEEKQEKEPRNEIPQPKAQSFPIEVKTRLDFSERLIGSPEKPQAVRHYGFSQAKILLNEKEMISELSEQNDLIVTRIKSDEGNRYQIASVADILQQKEYDLLRNPADSLSFINLFTKAGVRVGDRWAPHKDDLARFLSVDYVIDSNVEIELKEVSTKNAILHFKGQLRAEVDDTSTEIAMAGVAHYDREESMIRGLRVNLQENRRAAQIAPGFNGRTKIDCRRSITETIPQLTNESLQAMSRSRSIRSLLKWRAESGQFEVTFEPSWRLISAVDDGAILRYVDNGDLLTQCNIVRLPSRPADKPLALADFEKEVAKVISKDPNSRVVSAQEGLTTAGVRAMRILVAGVEKELPVNWIYYNLSSPDGRQVTFVFTAEEQVLGRIATASQNLVNGFSFRQVTNQQSVTGGSLPKHQPTSQPSNNRDSSSVSSTAATGQEQIR